MSTSHLRQLVAALSRHGWHIDKRRRGDADVRGSATWEIRRGEAGPPLLLDFEGFGGLGEDISLEESHGCRVRGLPVHLYFSRVKRSRERWAADLRAFVAALDRAATA